jgi:hypothetical protein
VKNSLVSKHFKTILLSAVFLGLLTIPNHLYAGLDAFDLSQAQIVAGSPSSVASWPATATISGVNLSPNISIDFDKKSGANRWPDQQLDPNAPPGPNNIVQYTVWLFLKIDNTWTGAGFIQMWTGRPDTGSPPENMPCDWYYTASQMKDHQLAPGEQVAFMVTAGNERLGTATDIEERSNVVFATLPSNLSAPHCQASPPGGNSSPDTSTVAPPDLTATGVVALSGKNPSLAYDPAKKLWLVVAENNGKIQGQFMTDQNTKNGSLLNIGGTNAHTPKVAYGININKYLVVWTSGTDPSASLKGKLLNEDGSAVGNEFTISTGGAHLYPNSNLQYDSRSKRFALAYEKRGARADILVAGISDSGTVVGPVNLTEENGLEVSGSEPSLVINLSQNSYCVTYLDSSTLNIQTVSPDGNVGNVTQIGEAEHNIGIIYNNSDKTYVASWLAEATIQSKPLNACADDPALSPATLASEVWTGILAQGLNGFGVFAVNLSGNSDHFITFDGSGNQSQEQLIFSGNWTNDGLAPAIGLQTTTGMFAAAASPNGQNVKFVGGIGSRTSISSNTQFPPSTTLPIPNQGLPTDIAQFIEAIFTWSLSLIGLVIFVRFFWAGLKWFSAQGRPGQIQEAQSIMKNALYGAVILFAAYLILNTINPDLVRNSFTLPGLPSSQSTNTGAGAATSCLTSAGSSYSEAMQTIENQVLDDNPDLADGPDSGTARNQFIQKLIAELKNNGYDTGLVKACDGSANTLPFSILVGFKSYDREAEMCAIFDPNAGGSDSDTIRNSIQASCNQRTSWNQLSQ